MKKKIVDSHCHLNLLGSKELIGIKEEDLLNTKKKIITSRLIESIKNHVEIIQNIFVTLEEFEKFYPIIFNQDNGILKVFKENSKLEENTDCKDDIENLKIFTSIGVHPLYPENEFDLEKANKLVSNPFVNAVGECGLDYHLEPDVETRRQQQKKFLLQIDFAARHNLPLIIHSRNAEGQTFHYLQHAFMQRNIKGVMHCFTGSKDFALKMIDIGFYISFPGIITFKKKVDHLVEIVKEIPLEKILIETDAPYLAPEPFRGKENNPCLVYYVCKKIAEIKNLDIEEVAFQTTQNYKKLFLENFKNFD